MWKARRGCAVTFRTVIHRRRPSVMLEESPLPGRRKSDTHMRHHISRPSVQSRHISSSSHCQKEPYSRYFWPSRPDFLPSKGGPEIIPRQATNGQTALKNAIKRYLPIEDASIRLPDPHTVGNVHAPLYTALAKEERESAWAHFTAHLGDLANGRVDPFTSEVFDALFWLLASEDDLSMDRQDEIVGRTRILLAYAESQGKYKVTRLQLHRTIYLWTTLLEQSNIQQVPFRHTDFLGTVQECLIELHGRLASRVAIQLLNTCTSHARLGSVIACIQDWIKDHPGYRSRRLESWTSSSKRGSQMSKLHFSDNAELNLEPLLWTRMLERCLRLGRSEQTVAAGMLAIQQPEVDPSLDVVSYFLALLDTPALFLALPSHLKGKEEYKAKNFDTLCEAATITPIPSERDRARLADAVIYVLATRDEVQPALLLLEQEPPTEQSLNWKRTELYTAALLACCRLARRHGQSQQWAYSYLQKAVHLFLTCQWHRSSMKDRVPRQIVKSFLPLVARGDDLEMSDQDEENASDPKAVERSQGRQKWISTLKKMLSRRRPLRSNLSRRQRWFIDQERSTSWRQRRTKRHLLLRYFTTALLTHDARLETLSGRHQKGFKDLLHLHVRLRDYAFAKRLFLVANMSDHPSPMTEGEILPRGDFNWLFQRSLSIEKSLNFSTQLFMHWTYCRDVSLSVGDETSPSPAYDILPSLFKMYFRRLANEGRGNELGVLQDYLSFGGVNNKKTLLQRGQAIRLLRTLFLVDEENMDLAFDLAFSIIQHWKKNRPEDMNTLVILYSMAMNKVAQNMLDIDALLRQRIMRMFQDFRNFLEGVPPRNRYGLARAVSDEVRIVYTAALNALTTSTEEVSSSFDTPIRTTTEKWITEVCRLTRTPKDANLWSAQIASLLYGSEADVIQARTAYLEAKADLLQQGNSTVSALVTSKLMIALAKGGFPQDALHIMETYSSGDERGTLTASRALIRGASVAVLQMQGQHDKAYEQVKQLEVEARSTGRYRTEREGKWRVPRWANLVRQVRREFEIRKREAQEQQAQSIQYAWADVKSDEEEEERRAKAFSALASGRPWKGKG